MLLNELISKAEEQKKLAYEKYQKNDKPLSLSGTMEYYMDMSNAFLKLLDGLQKLEWQMLSERYPEPHRNIIIQVDGKSIKTRTYNHFGKLMIELKDGNKFFAGASPKLLDQTSLWCYDDNVELIENNKEW